VFYSLHITEVSEEGVSIIIKTGDYNFERSLAKVHYLTTKLITTKGVFTSNLV